MGRYLRVEVEHDPDDLVRDVVGDLLPEEDDALGPQLREKGIASDLIQLRRAQLDSQCLCLILFVHPSSVSEHCSL